MTYEEAIEILQEEHDYCQEMSYVIEALEMAIKVFEKQIPKKPRCVSLTAYKFSYDCPSCGTKHVNEWCGTNRHLPFCSICGQALEWEV